MALFENFPYTNLHNLNLDWIMQVVADFKEHFDEYKEEVDAKVNKPLDDPNGQEGYLLMSKGDGNTEWIDYDPIVEPLIDEAVSEWLDEHPEATTTVEDNSITSAKLKKDNIPFYNVTDYGIMPNTGDVYTALHALLKDYVYHTGGIVYFPKGKYTISYTIWIPENTIFVGEGFDSEIYFDETDTTCGVGLSNGGSNVGIYNIKCSQYDIGTFHDGAQAGCVGFSNWSKEMVVNSAYSHEWHYTTEPVHDIVVDTVYFHGKYALQTEPTANGYIYDVAYKNITAPLSCVSIKPTVDAKIANVICQNIYCNLFRIRGSANFYTSGIAENILIENVASSSFIFRVQSANNPLPLYCKNLSTTGEEFNQDITSTEIFIAANIIFDNCKFDMQNAIYQYMDNYTRVYRYCYIRSQDRLFNNAGTLATDYSDKTIIENCDLVQIASGGQVLGYGKDNRYTGTFTKRVYGDVHSEVALSAPSPTGTFANRLIHDFGTTHLHLFATIENTNSVFTVPSTMEVLYNCPNAFPVTIWNTSDIVATRVHTYARVVNGVIEVREPDFRNSTAYNRILICTPITISAIPTMTGLMSCL